MPPVEPKIQSSFKDGMNLIDQDVAIGPAEYCLAFNVRNRTTALEPIRAPVKDNEPTGKKQGIYAFDKYVLLFCGGKAYYKNILTGSDWTLIAGFYCDTSADYVYAEVVPASTINFQRVLIVPDKVDGTPLTDAVNITSFQVNGTVAGLVVQDGKYQPWIILPDGTARRIQTYDQWSITGNREYVPIMTKMRYVNGILFGIAPDGRTIYRSVSGRPLDFVVNVDINGNKGGDATTTSYGVSYDPITCLQSLSSGDLLAATLKTCYPIEFNYDQTIFGEPQFRNRKSFSAGVVNQFSFIDTLGDSCFIDTDGIRSFNAVNISQNEGRNSIFSRNLGPVLANKQDITAAIVFDNFAMFSIKTALYGYCIAVADLTRVKQDESTGQIYPSWVCLDRFTELDGPIKQFAIADQSENPTLYCITENSVYVLYTSSSYLEAQVYFRAISSGKGSSEIKLERFRAVLDYSFARATATATEILNNKPHSSVVEKLGVDADEVYGMIDNTMFNFERDSGQGWKVQPKLQWQNEAKLQLIEMELSEITRKTNVRQAAKLYAGS